MSGDADEARTWNDAPGRTQAEVLAENQRMIDRAAEMGV